MNFVQILKYKKNFLYDRATGYVKDRPKLRVAGQRLVRCFMYARLTPDDNPYAHPLDFTCSKTALK